MNVFVVKYEDRFVDPLVHADDIDALVAAHDEDFHEMVRAAARQAKAHPGEAVDFEDGDSLLYLTVQGS